MKPKAKYTYVPVHFVAGDGNRQNALLGNRVCQ